MNWQWALEVVKSHPVRRMLWSPGWRVTTGGDGKLIYSHPGKGKPTTFIPMQLDKDATDWVHVDPAAAKRAERDAATKAAQAKPRKPRAKK